MISLICCTYRPGGLDVLALSFRETPPSADYELVIVDDCPGRVERGRVRPFLEQQQGVRLGWHGPSKPKNCPDTKGGLCNAWNTALMHCRGDFTVFVSDYAWLPQNWLDQWQRAFAYFGAGNLLSGGGILYNAPKPVDPGDVQTWEDPVTPRPRAPWVPTRWENFYWGCYFDWWNLVNGMDERADHCHCWPVSSQARQAEILGWGLQVMPEVACHMVDHRLWDEAEPAPAGCGSEGLWRITGELQSLPEEPDWGVPSPNDFDLMKEREKCLR